MRTQPSGGKASLAKVIDGGFCIGCGACTAISDTLAVTETANGEFRVQTAPRDEAVLERGSKVCPFAEAPNEDQLAAALFPDAQGHHDGVGRYVDLHAGWSVAQRANAGSGGITRWMLSKMLREGVVDYVVQVDSKQVGEDGQALFQYAVHDNADTLLERASASAYYPVTMSQALQMIRERDGVCAVTALPCFSRALRALAIEEPVFGQKIKFIAGTICGHLKSKRYADYLAHQLGVDEDLGRLNFRGKSESRAANEKCVEVWRDTNDSDTPDKVSRVQQLKGTNYGLGYFKYKGCDYCDDVLAETADVSFGDAWIDPYRKSPQGTNVVVVRNPEVAAFLRDGQAAGELELFPLTPEQVVLSQASGLNHRREGLAVRLWLSHMAGRWTPRKRVRPRSAGLWFTGVHVMRILLRRVTASPRQDVRSPGFERTLKPYVRLHGLFTKLRNRGLKSLISRR